MERAEQRKGEIEMSNQINSFTVILRHDVGEEYAEKLEEAVLLFGAVLSVEMNITDVMDIVNHQRIKNDLIHKLIKELK